MITKWGLKNFKSIREAELEMAPLTILTGVNSSGKSSLLQSIAMLAQSARSKDKQQLVLKGDLVDLGSFEQIYCKKASENAPDQPANIKINFSLSSEENKLKEQIDFEFEYGFSKKETNPQINSTCMTYKDEETNKDGVYIQFNRYSDGDSIILDAVSADEIEKNVPPYYKKTGINFRKPEGIKYDSGFIPCKLKYPFELSDEFIGKVVDFFILIITDYIHIRKEMYEFESFDHICEFMEKCAKSAVVEKKMQLESGLLKGLENFEGIDFANIYNMGFLFYNKMSVLDKSIDEKVTRGNELIYYGDDHAMYPPPPYVYEEHPQGIAIWYQDVLNLNDEDKNEIYNKITGESFKKAFKDMIRTSFGSIESAFPNLDGFIDLPKSKLKDAYNYLNKYFNTKIKYLGPLRQEPKFGYEPIDHYEDVDARGINTAAVIDYMWREGQVKKYISPRNPDFIEKEPNSFGASLHEWMGYVLFDDNYKLDFVIQKLPSKKIKSEKIKFKIFSDGGGFFLSQLGTGVTWVLPILVACLAAEPGSTIIIQEPEAHLHPKVQSRLADFFIAMALSGRQCIIETHSEYLIYALRYRISESLLRNDETIQEATKIYFAEKNNGISEFQEIKVTKRGGISAWPEDFFDERQKLSEKILDAIISQMDDEDA